jgi:hypothetical protein
LIELSTQPAAGYKIMMIVLRSGDGSGTRQRESRIP